MRHRARVEGPALWLSCCVALWTTALAARTGDPAQSAAQQLAPVAPVQAGTYAPDGEKTCLGCHSGEPASLILQTPHAIKADPRTPFAQHQCESCHGASPEHLDKSENPVSVSFKGKDASPVEKRNAMCLACHQAGMRTHWTSSQHESRGVACTDCHNIHAKEPKVLNRATQAEVCFTCHKAQRAEVRRISTHPLAITSLANAPKMVCSDCHNLHGSSGPRLLIKNSVNETCFTCHAEKRGPYLWEHAPVSDDCTSCHTPHGSSNPSLLKARSPWLCQECHSGDHGNQVNSGANLANGLVTTVNGAQQPGAAAPRAQMNARACLNCHVLIHGSNHPAGSKFQR